METRARQLKAGFNLNKMNQKEKILACHGHLTYRSIASVVGCSQSYVSQTLFKAGKRAVRKRYSYTELVIK